MAKVSVLIPTYNYGRFLDEAIVTILEQSYSDYELIILDNCSTDNTREIISKYLGDSRVKYFRNNINIGNINNFNKILKLANTDYIKFVFADDQLLPNTLEKFVRVLDENKDVSLVTSNFEYFGSLSSIHKQPKIGKVIGYDAIKSTILTFNWIGAPSNVMFRKSYYDGLGFNGGWRWWADLEFWHRLLQNGNLYVIPEVLSRFRYHTSSATNTCIENFENTHDEYYYLRQIRKRNLYSPLKEDSDFKIKLRQNAKNWVAQVPAFLRAKRTDLLFKALLAIGEEKLLFETGINLMKSLKYKLLKET